MPGLVATLDSVWRRSARNICCCSTTYRAVYCQPRYVVGMSMFLAGYDFHMQGSWPNMKLSALLKNCKTAPTMEYSRCLLENKKSDWGTSGDGVPLIRWAGAGIAIRPTITHSSLEQFVCVNCATHDALAWPFEHGQCYRLESCQYYASRR